MPWLNSIGILESNIATIMIMTKLIAACLTYRLNKMRLAAIISTVATIRTVTCGKGSPRFAKMVTKLGDTHFKIPAARKT